MEFYLARAMECPLTMQTCFLGIVQHHRLLLFVERHLKMINNKRMLLICSQARNHRCELPLIADTIFKQKANVIFFCFLLKSSFQAF